MGQSKNTPAGQTTVTGTNAPWAPQQPYLAQGFQGAQNLYQSGGPQYYPGSTYYSGTAHDLNNTIQQIVGAGNNLWNQDINSLFPQLTSLAGGQGNANNPALNNGYLSSLSGGNYSNPELGTLQGFGSSNPTLSSPGLSNLESLLGQNFGSNAGVGSLSSLAGTNLGQTGLGAQNLEGLASGYGPGQGTLNDLANTNLGYAGAGPLGYFSGNNIGTSNPGTSTLENYAGGAYMSNPYTNALSQNVLSQVVPGIESQFINGGSLSSPQAAYSTAQGATNALAPVLFNNYQTQEQLQQNAASQLGSQALSGRGLQQGAAQNLAQNILSGGGLQAGAAGALQSGASNAASSLLSGGIAGGGLQANAANSLLSGNLQQQGLQANEANNLISQYLGGQGLQQSGALNAANIAAQTPQLATNAALGQGNIYNTGLGAQISALGQGPAQIAAALGIPQAQYGAQQQGQQNEQNALNAAVQQWNYNQTLPWQALNQYLGQVGGNYGGQTATNTPFYQNNLAGLGSGALTGGLLGSSLFAPANAATGATGGLLSGLGIGQGAGTGIGAGLFGLLGLLGGSDRRLKADIKQIGTLPNGLGLYRFRYTGDTVGRVGVMSDEVRRFRPDAVSVTPFGFDVVDYGKALAA